MNGQLFEYVAECVLVEILAEQVGQHEIAELEALDQQVGAVAARRRQPAAQDGGAQAARVEHQKPVREINGRDQREQHEPEPEQNVDFLVDYVQCQDAQSVVFVYRTFN